MRSGPATLAVLGAGSWGTALALHWTRHGHAVRLWARRAEVVKELARGTSPYLPGLDVAGLSATADLAEAADGAQAWILAVPSWAVEEVARALGRLGSSAPAITAAKGFQAGTGRRLSQVVDDVLGGPSLVLLGPSHAEEVARGLPTAIVLAGGEAGPRSHLQAVLSSPHLRIYTNDDLAGVETAAALKNVLAIAAGICDGLGLGDNTKGALLTRGLAEIARLGRRLGGKTATYYGLSGIGDIITTCLSRHSRNRALGERVGRGQTLATALGEIGQAVEGVGTTETVVELARRHRVSMPICREVARVLFEAKPPREAIEELMVRSLKAEHDPASLRGEQEV